MRPTRLPPQVFPMDDEDPTPVTRRASWMSRLTAADPDTAAAVRALVENAFRRDFSKRELEETGALVVLKAIERHHQGIGDDRARHTAGVHQGPPVANNRTAAWDHVLALVKDMKDERELEPRLADAFLRAGRSRDHLGLLRYGVRLQPFNGRSAVADASDEGLDLCAYLGQLHLEHLEKAESARPDALAGDLVAEMVFNAETQRASSVAGLLLDAIGITACLLSARPAAQG